MADHDRAMDTSPGMKTPMNLPLPLPFSPQPPDHSAIARPQADVPLEDSANTRDKEVERHNRTQADDHIGDEERASKRVKLDDEPAPTQTEYQKGVAPIKKEYLVDLHAGQNGVKPDQADDDAAEASGKTQPEPVGGRGGKKTQGGQNSARSFGSSKDAIQLCRSREKVNEFAPQTCSFGDKCKLSHDLRKYLSEGKREDLKTFEAGCPIFEAKGLCNSGWRCRFAGSHSQEITHEDGRKELVLMQQSGPTGTQVQPSSPSQDNTAQDTETGDIVNVVGIELKRTLGRKKFPTPKADEYLAFLDKQQSNNGKKTTVDGTEEEKNDDRASYVEQPFRPSEKRRIYYGPETPVLAPLTTQGNPPFRQLCVELGAQLTFGEMAMGLPLIQGEKQEWALVKAHKSELAPPAYNPKNVVTDYDNSKDIRFGIQIAANKPALAVKTTEILTKSCNYIRVIDLNCGCPIDLVYKQGAGSALLDAPGKLEKILRGMNAVSGETPISVKIRMGTKDKKPDADKLCERLIMGGAEAQEQNLMPAGVAAITLHGRSRQQRYTRSADWEYIAHCATLIKDLKTKTAEVTDTIREPDARDLPPTNSGLPYFCGNGDILSHEEYNDHIKNAGVDSCMIGRGALVKPWIFEEISSGQHLDKSASERLGYIEKFCRNGLDYWGSDEVGVGTTRRFLLEWLSFSCRYIPAGILEHLPQKFGDRPPAFRGRNELETLLSSSNYNDWKTISEMFLGPAHKDFNFQPKHKSNSYEIEAEG